MKHYYVTFCTGDAVTVAANGEEEAKVKAIVRMNEIIAHIAIANPGLDDVCNEDIAAVEIEE